MHGTRKTLDQPAILNLNRPGERSLKHETSRATVKHNGVFYNGRQEI